MPEIIQKNLSSILTVLSIAVAGITGYTTLRNSVDELQKNRVTLAEFAEVRKDIAELHRNMRDSHIRTVHTTVNDMSREIDTLYTKAELALENTHALKAEFTELRGEFSAHKRYECKPKADR